VMTASTNALSSGVFPMRGSEGGARTWQGPTLLRERASHLARSRWGQGQTRHPDKDPKGILVICLRYAAKVEVRGKVRLIHNYPSSVRYNLSSNVTVAVDLVWYSSQLSNLYYEGAPGSSVGADARHLAVNSHR